MIKLWRGLAASALAAGLAVGGAAAPAFAAGSAAPRVTIGARSHLRPVGRDVYVVWNLPRLGAARVLGRVSRAARGDKVELLAQEFPYNTPYAPAATHTVRTRTSRYSFDVSPNLATRYRVELFNSSGTTQLASSARTIVYVTPYVVESAAPGPCSSHTCRRTIGLTVYQPSSAVNVEHAKRVYPYSGLAKNATPRWLYRNADHARVTVGQLSLNSNQYTVTIKFTYRWSGRHQPYWDWTACTKDTLAKDGMGLPGHHGCGARRVRSNVRYLG